MRERDKENKREVMLLRYLVDTTLMVFLQIFRFPIETSHKTESQCKGHSPFPSTPQAAKAAAAAA